MDSARHPDGGGNPSTACRCVADATEILDEAGCSVDLRQRRESRYKVTEPQIPLLERRLKPVSHE